MLIVREERTLKPGDGGKTLRDAFGPFAAHAYVLDPR